MNIGLQFDARDHPAGIGNLLATGRVTAGNHRGLHAGQWPKLKRIQSVKKALLLDLQQRQIAIVPDEQHPGLIHPRVLVPP